MPAHPALGAIRIENEDQAMKLHELSDRPGARKKRSRIGRVSELIDTPSVRGMIAKVQHIVRVVDAK